METDIRPISPSRVLVCSVSVATCCALIPALKRCLRPEELARGNRFHREADQHRFIIGRSMIRRLGARHFGIEHQLVGLGQSANGKPHFVGNAGDGRARLEFNVSHSGDSVFIAWSNGSPVGVDVEEADFNPTLSYPELAAASFSDAECEVLSATGEEEHTTFYRTWVRKEALLKAEGWGLSGPLKGFSVVKQSALGCEWLDRVESPQSGHIWAVRDIPCAPGYQAALAMPEGCEVHFVSPAESGLLPGQDE